MSTTLETRRDEMTTVVFTEEELNEIRKGLKLLKDFGKTANAKSDEGGDAGNLMMMIIGLMFDSARERLTKGLATVMPHIEELEKKYGAILD